MIKGIGHCAFNVRDMETSLAFYENALGFTKAFEIHEPETGEPWIIYMYAGGEQFIELFYGAENVIPYSPANAGFFHLCVQVDDIDEAWARLVAAGAPQDDAPKTGCDGNRQCWTHDPDGVKVELMELRAGSPHMNFLDSLQK